MVPAGVFQWMGIYVPEDGSMFGLVAFAPGLPQLRRAAPDVVVALAFALGLSVVSAAGLALVLRDLHTINPRRRTARFLVLVDTLNV